MNVKYLLCHFNCALKRDDRKSNPIIERTIRPAVLCNLLSILFSFVRISLDRTAFKIGFGLKDACPSDPRNVAVLACYGKFNSLFVHGDHLLIFGYLPPLPVGTLPA